MSETDKRVESLRETMRQRGIDAYIIFGTDPHQSEYASPRFAARSWLTGFTGSAGSVLITLDHAGLWTDYRYFLQAETQLSGSIVELHRMGLPETPTIWQYAISTLAQGSRIAIADYEIPIGTYKQESKRLNRSGLSLEATDDLLEEIWKDRPGLPKGRIREVDTKIAGETREHKFSRILKAAGDPDALLISRLDEIAWALNARGDETGHNPLFMSYLLLSSHGHILFCNQESDMDESLRQSLEGVLTILPYQELGPYLERNADSFKNIYLSWESTSMRVGRLLENRIPVIGGPDIITPMKAIKNGMELEGMREAHVWDGVAMVEFLSYVDNHLDGVVDTMDELSFAECLLGFRSRGQAFLSESFSPIVGFGDHGAIVHYSATRESASMIGPEGIMILDTGGQYSTGTTDITRTLLFGKATEKQRMDYTLVLKAHIAFVRQQFPTGTCGYQIDAITRSILWNHGMEYGHGTGHGVGHMLNVHEGPQVVNPKPISIPLEPGMVMSNEPGIYRKGEHGIRIENLVYVSEGERTEFGTFLHFEDLTLCPYERRLIERTMLTAEEIAHIDAYHKKVYERLSPHLSKEAEAWLKQQTRSI